MQRLGDKKFESLNSHKSVPSLCRNHTHHQYMKVESTEKGKPCQKHKRVTKQMNMNTHHMHNATNPARIQPNCKNTWCVSEPNPWGLRHESNRQYRTNPHTNNSLWQTSSINLKHKKMSRSKSQSPFENPNHLLKPSWLIFYLLLKNNCSYKSCVPSY